MFEILHGHLKIIDGMKGNVKSGDIPNVYSFKSKRSLVSQAAMMETSILT